MGQDRTITDKELQQRLRNGETLWIDETGEFRDRPTNGTSEAQPDDTQPRRSTVRLRNEEFGA